MELRTCIDALRSDRSISAYSWTDSTLTTGTTEVEAVHLTDLRTALGGVFSHDSVTAPTYTDSTITAGTTTIRAVHFMELRYALRTVGGGCSWSVTPTSATVDGWGGEGGVSVTTQSGCEWTAQSASGGVSLSSSSATGSGSVTYTVTANPSGSSPRTLTLTVARTTVTLTQALNPCLNAPTRLTPTSASFNNALGGSSSVAVGYPAACSYSAVSSAGWLTTDSYRTPTLTYTVAANTGAARSGTLTIAGVTFNVTQAGAWSSTGTDVSYLDTDAIGSVRMITDAAGDVVARYDYTPFGALWDSPALQTSLAFAFMQRDDSGQDYAEAR